MLISFPSGLRADIRPLRGREIIAIAEEQNASSSDGGFGSILGGAWVGTADAGPYMHVQVGDGRPDFARLLKGDLVYGFIQLRRMSLPDGNDFDFDVHCEQCKTKYGWTVELSDLPIRELSEESAEKMMRSEAFETSMQGRKVRFQLQTMAQEEPVRKLMKQQKRKTTTIVDLLTAQTVSVEGLKSQDVKQRWQWFADLQLSELYELREAFEKPDCGVETGITTKCQNGDCGWEQDVTIPFGKTFFAPRKLGTKKDSQPFSAMFSGASSESTSGSTGITSNGSSTEEAGTAG